LDGIQDVVWEDWVNFSRDDVSLPSIDGVERDEPQSDRELPDDLRNSLHGTKQCWNALHTNMLPKEIKSWNDCAQAMPHITSIVRCAFFGERFQQASSITRIIQFIPYAYETPL
jgi:hypothetical protein